MATALDSHGCFIYYKIVYQLRLFGLLLRPSVFSGLLTSVAAGLLLAVSNWSYLVQNPMFRDYFFGRFGITATLRQSTSLFDSKIFDQPYTYYVAVILVAVLVGMLVYIVLESLGRGFAGAKQTISEIGQSYGASRRSVEAEIGTRWSVRVSSVVMWAFYWVFFINALLPFCVLASRGNGVNQSLGLVYGALGFAVLWLGLHQHVIFARLIVLRPRLFGGRRVMDAELYHA